MRRASAGILVTTLIALGLTGTSGRAQPPAAPGTQKPTPAVSHRQSDVRPLAAAASAPSPRTAAEAQTATVKQYCAVCHSERGRAGGVSLATFDVTTAAQHADVAEKMVRKLRLGMMPPPGAKRPAPEALTALVAALEGRLDAAAAAKPDSGVAAFPAAQSRRVCARGQGPARCRHRRRRTFAGRHDQRRFRQHCRLTDVLADVAVELPARRRQGHDAGARRRGGLGERG